MKQKNTLEARKEKLQQQLKRIDLQKEIAAKREELKKLRSK